MVSGQINPHTDAIAEQAERLLDVSIERHHDRQADETFIQCHVCGDWDGHKSGCFVPAITEWLAQK